MGEEFNFASEPLVVFDLYGKGDTGKIKRSVCQKFAFAIKQPYNIHLLFDRRNLLLEK